MKSLRLVVGAAVFSAPIMTGFAYTAANTVGVDGIFSEGSESQISIGENGEEYTLDYSQFDGVETLIVTDRDGNVVSEDDYPGFVEEAAEELKAANGMPEDEDIVGNADGSAGTLIRDLGGTYCYDAEVTAADAANGAFGVEQSDSKGTFAIEVSAEGDVDAVHLEGEIPHEVFAEQRNNGAPYAELEGAQQLGEC